jgi:hypothetical protein
MFVFHVLQGRSGIPGLPFIIIIGNFNVAQLQLQSAVGVAEGSDLLLEVVLRRIAFRLGLLVFGLQEDEFLFPVASSIPVVYGR